MVANLSGPDVVPVILAGGSGTRLWPLSRETYPKQLLKLSGEKSLLQDTVTRLVGLPDEVSVPAPMIVCNEEHRFLVADQLEESQPKAGMILLEPASRNTAPALTLAALRAQDLYQDPVLLVMPADHVVTKTEPFHRAILSAINLAARGMIVTMGIVPSRVETGFGYIKVGSELSDSEGSKAYKLHSFVEKPDEDSARAYVKSGEYLWNSGLFIVKAKVWLNALRKFRPDILSAIELANKHGVDDGVFYRADPHRFKSCPSESIDFAVMQNLSSVPTPGAELAAAVIALDAGWSDVGSWPALLEVNQPDENGNVLYGDTVVQLSKNSVLVSDHRLVAALGIEDTVVVETADAVLVMHKDRAQDVKQIVDTLKAAGRDEGKSHRRIFRPWGDYEKLDMGERYQVKRLTVKPGEALSLQMHHHRAEHWVVVKGTAKVTRGEDVFLLTENQSTYIPIGATHRLENPGTGLLEIIEVQSGGYLGEDDIVRFEDVYNR